MNAKKTIELAAVNMGGVMRSSAELCLQDARNLLAKGDEKAAHVRALKSLRYSVGGFHPAYQEAERG